jgi:hypothetical protein
LGRGDSAVSRLTLGELAHADGSVHAAASVTAQQSSQCQDDIKQGRRWIERPKQQNAGAGFGAAVAIRDHIIIVGAPCVDLPNEDPFMLPR